MDNQGEQGEGESSGEEKAKTNAAALTSKRLEGKAMMMGFRVPFSVPISIALGYFGWCRGGAEEKAASNGLGVESNAEMAQELGAEEMSTPSDQGTPARAAWLVLGSTQYTVMSMIILVAPHDP